MLGRAGDKSMPLEPDRYADLSEFRLALRRFLAASEAISKDAGITQQQYQAILAIAAWGARAMAMKDLAEQLLLTHHAAVQLVDRLEKLGLARRSPSAGDRRIVHLKLTPQGAALLDRLAGHHLQELRRQEPSLSHSLARIRRSRA
jgi:DNA-binding MarR family transcriptional regulator